MELLHRLVGRETDDTHVDTVVGMVIPGGDDDDRSCCDEDDATAATAAAAFSCSLADRLSMPNGWRCVNSDIMGESLWARSAAL